MACRIITKYENPGTLNKYFLYRGVGIYNIGNIMPGFFISIISIISVVLHHNL